jgi:GMP synthase-like glutamine amidotransferase
VPGAEWLARSELYPHQAFRVGTRAYGLQFHVEVDRALAEGWREHLPEGIEIPEPARADVGGIGEAILAAFFADTRRVLRRYSPRSSPSPDAERRTISGGGT